MPFPDASVGDPATFLMTLVPAFAGMTNYSAGLTYGSLRNLGYI
jgi:hypothetical protein